VKNRLQLLEVTSWFLKKIPKSDQRNANQYDEMIVLDFVTNFIHLLHQVVTKIGADVVAVGEINNSLGEVSLGITCPSPDMASNAHANTSETKIDPKKKTKVGSKKRRAA
jgi:hypothetical protein